MTLNHPKGDTSQTRKGFSIIELIVTMTIFVTISTVMLFNYNSLNRRLTLDTLAQETAQWVRQTQVTALSVKRTTATAVFPGYGLYFDLAHPNQFIYFADRDKSGSYSSDLAGAACGTAASECEQVIMLPKGTALTGLCGEETTAGLGTPPCGTLFPVNQVSIVFTRPDPDAFLSDNSGTPGGVFSRVQMTLSSSQNYKRMIEVWTTGQISVK